MIASKSQSLMSRNLETMPPEDLIGLIIQADLPLLQLDVASRLVNSDPLSLRRLAFLAMLSSEADGVVPMT